MKKIMKFGAAALFLFTLLLNVNMSLDDPFVYMSDTAFATGSDSGGTGTLWIETKHDCSVIYDGTGIVETAISFTKFTRTFTVPVGYNFDIDGTWSTTFTNVDIDCESGGTFLCTPTDCASFWASLPD